MIITTQHYWLSASRLLITNVYCFFLLNISRIFSLHFLVLFYIIFGLHYYYILCLSTPSASLVTLIYTHLPLSVFGSLWQRCRSTAACCRVKELTAAILVGTTSFSWEPHEQYGKAKRNDTERWTPRSASAQYATGEEQRNSTRRNEKAESSRNNAQLWMCLMVKVKSDAVKNNIAQEPGMLGSWIKANWKRPTGEGKSEHRHFRHQWTKMNWNGQI